MPVHVFGVRLQSEDEDGFRGQEREEEILNVVAGCCSFLDWSSYGKTHLSCVPSPQGLTNHGI